MIQKKDIFSSAGLYAFANIISAGIPFFLLPILTRVLSPTDYGIITMFSAVLVVLGAFTGLNTNSALTVRYFQQDIYDLPSYVSTCLVILIASMVLILFIVLVAMDWLVSFTHIPSKWLMIAICLSASQFISQTILYLWRASNKALQYSAMQITQSSINALLTLYFVLVCGWAWEGRVAGQGISICIISSLALILLRMSGWIKGKPRRDYAVDALKFGAPLIFHVIGALMISLSDRFMISNLLDLKQTGVYMVGMQVGMALGLLTDSFNKSFGPWLFSTLKNNDDCIKKIIVRYTYLYFLIVTTIAIVIGMSAPWLLEILVGEAFRGAAHIVIYIAMGYAFQGMYFMVTNYIFFMSKTHYLSIVTFCCGAFNIGLSYILIRKFGLDGAAISFMISQAIFFIITWILANRVFPMPWTKLIVK